MKQSESQRIGLRANDIFNYLRPQNWVIRSQQEIDLGIDYEIEFLTNEGETTGALAKIQLKGSENLSYINNKQFISFSLELDNAHYLIDEINIPTYLIVCDNNSEKCYWVSLKNDRALETNYRQALNNNQKTFSIHINTNNDISNTNSQFIEDVILTNKLIAVKSISKIQFNDYENININPDDCEQVLLNQIENVWISKMQILYSDNKYEEVLKLTEKYLNSDKSIMLKFNTLAYKREALKKVALTSKLYQIDKISTRSKIQLDIATEYVELTKELADDDILKILSESWLNIAILNELSTKFQWLNISIKQHEENPDDSTGFWLLTASSQIKELYAAIADLLVKIITAIHSIVASNQQLMVLDIMSEFVLSLSGFLFFFARDNQEGFEALEKNINSLIDFTLKIAQTNSLWTKYAVLNNVKLQYISLYININRQLYGQKLRHSIYPNIFKIPEKKLQKEMIASIKEYTQGLIDCQKTSHDYFSIEEEIALLKQQMQGLGVNIEKPQNDYDKAIVEAINAINPERVLRPCMHRFIYVTTSPIGKMIKLYTLGLKGMYCTKHDYNVQYVYLDGLSELMTNQCCSKCKDKESHPDSWHWTREWQQEQNKKYIDKIKL